MSYYGLLFQVFAKGKESIPQLDRMVFLRRRNNTLLMLMPGGQELAFALSDCMEPKNLTNLIHGIMENLSSFTGFPNSIYENEYQAIVCAGGYIHRVDYDDLFRRADFWELVRKGNGNLTNVSIYSSFEYSELINKNDQIPVSVSIFMRNGNCLCNGYVSIPAESSLQYILFRTKTQPIATLLPGFNIHDVYMENINTAYLDNTEISLFDFHRNMIFYPGSKIVLLLN